MKLLGNNILVAEAKPSNISESGLLIPESVKERPNKGVIHLVGPGTLKDAMSLKLGDNVLFNEGAGIKIILPDGLPYLLMKENDVFLNNGQL